MIVNNIQNKDENSKNVIYLKNFGTLSGGIRTKKISSPSSNMIPITGSVGSIRRVLPVDDSEVKKNLFFPKETKNNHFSSLINNNQNDSNFNISCMKKKSPFITKNQNQQEPSNPVLNTNNISTNFNTDIKKKEISSFEGLTSNNKNSSGEKTTFLKINASNRINENKSNKNCNNVNPFLSLDKTQNKNVERNNIEINSNQVNSIVNQTNDNILSTTIQNNNTIFSCIINNNSSKNTLDKEKLSSSVNKKENQNDNFIKNPFLLTNNNNSNANNKNPYNNLIDNTNNNNLFNNLTVNINDNKKLFSSLTDNTNNKNLFTSIKNNTNSNKKELTNIKDNNENNKNLCENMENNKNKNKYLMTNVKDNTNNNKNNFSNNFFYENNILFSNKNSSDFSNINKNSILNDNNSFRNYPFSNDNNFSNSNSIFYNNNSFFQNCNNNCNNSYISNSYFLKPEENQKSMDLSRGWNELLNSNVYEDPFNPRWYNNENDFNKKIEENDIEIINQRINNYCRENKGRKNYLEFCEQESLAIKTIKELEINEGTGKKNFSYIDYCNLRDELNRNFQL